MADRSQTSPALEIVGLDKSYRVGHLRGSRRLVLQDLHLQVPRGEIFGYLGPNGSGKTTTLKVLMGLIYPDAGSIQVLGLAHEDRSWRYRVGFLPEQPYLYDYLTAREYLDYVGRLFGMPPGARRERSRELLSRLGLERAAGVPLRRFSKGMVQRAGLAQALMNDPEFIILDEPMSGLDPIGRRLVSDLILEFKKGGKTVLFSTHILSDAEALCDRVAVLRQGRLRDVGRLSDILRLDFSHMQMMVSGVDESAFGSIDSELSRRQAVGERWRLEVPEKALGHVVQLIEKAGGRVLSVQPIRQSLEDYFFKELGADQGEPPWGGED
jgi:ABC-2 type transport system ATP-binding protein